MQRKKYEQRLHKLGITSLEDRHIRADLIQVYKILNDKDETYPSDFLKKVIDLEGEILKNFLKRDVNWIYARIASL